MVYSTFTKLIEKWGLWYLRIVFQFNDAPVAAASGIVLETIAKPPAKNAPMIANILRIFSLIWHHI